MLSNQPISDLFQQNRPLHSLEFFPPQSDEGVANLRATAQALKSINPDFASVTYGAGGSTSKRTAQVGAILKNELGYTVMPHLTCVGHSQEELRDIADTLHADGYRNIMALRGDPPKGAVQFEAAPDGLSYANELVALLKKQHSDFCIGVGGYPEKHPEAASLDEDLDNLKRKVDAGADFVTTQLFFDNAVYFSFVEKCRARGIKVPIVPGIMPALSMKQILRITEMCGAILPVKLMRRLEVAGDNAAVVEAVGIDWALMQIRELVAQGAPGYHLYILNRASTALILAAGLVE